MSETIAFVRVLAASCDQCGARSKGWDIWHQDGTLNMRLRFPFTTEAHQVRERMDASCYRKSCDGRMLIETEPADD